MIEYRIATDEDIELMMNSRLEMLKVVNDLPADYAYSDTFLRESRDYFLNGDQTTVLAIDNEIVVGCFSTTYRYRIITNRTCFCSRCCSNHCSFHRKWRGRAHSSG